MIDLVTVIIYASLLLINRLMEEEEEGKSTDMISDGRLVSFDEKYPVLDIAEASTVGG